MIIKLHYLGDKPYVPLVPARDKRTGKEYFVGVLLLPQETVKKDIELEVFSKFTWGTFSKDRKAISKLRMTDREFAQLSW